MESVSGRDASNFYLATSASVNISEAQIREVLNRIVDPKLFKLGVDARLDKLKKAGKSESDLEILRKKYNQIFVLKKKEFKRATAEAKKQKRLDDEQERLHNLAYKFIQFVDKNDKSKILDRGGNPSVQWLNMSYEDKNLSVEFRYQLSPHSNGYQQVKVMTNGRVVFEIEGPAFGIKGQKVKVYIPGKWESKITGM